MFLIHFMGVGGGGRSGRTSTTRLYSQLILEYSVNLQLGNWNQMINSYTFITHASRYIVHCALVLHMIGNLPVYYKLYFIIYSYQNILMKYNCVKGSF